MKLTTTLLTGATALGLAGTALAQESEVTPLTDWDATQIEGAWSAERMTEADVYGEDGDLVGHVQGLIVGADNMVERVVMETDNWFDIADRTISVPWDNIELTPQSEGISVPLDEDEMNDFSLFGDDESANVSEKAFRASDILDEYVTLEDGTGYGYVTDLVFSKGGELSSVVVSPDAGFGGADYAGGSYAYPYYGYDYGYDPLATGWTLPYAESDVLDYQPMDDGWLDDDV